MEPTPPSSNVPAQLFSSLSDILRGLRSLFRVLWSYDRFFLLALFGVILAVVGMRRVESAVAQPFLDFWLNNKNALSTAGAGMLLFLAGCFSGPRESLHPDSALAKGRPRRRFPFRRLVIFRGLGLLLLLAGAGCYAYTHYRIVTQSRGLLPPAAFFASLILVTVGLGCLEHRRFRGWFRDLGIGHHQRGLPWWKRDVPYLAVFLAAWFVILFQKLETRPGFFHGDEATIVLYGRNTYYFDDLMRNAPPWHTVYAPYMCGIPRAGIGDLWPTRPFFGPRMFMLSVSTVALGILFVLVRVYLGRWAAWLALILTAGNHIVIAFARMAIVNMDALTLLLLWALAWMGAWRSRRASMGFLAGVFPALGNYTYPGALLGFPVTLLLLGIQWIRNPRALFHRWVVIAAFCIGLVSVYAPMRVYYRNDPKGMQFRTGMVYLHNKKNLEVEMNRTQSESLPELLMKLSWPAVGGVLLWPDTSSNYRYANLPLINREAIALLLLGLAGGLVWMYRRRFIQLLWVWCVAGIVVASLLTTSPPPPYAPRMMVNFPAAFILAAWVLAELIRRAWHLGGRWLGIPVLAAAFLLAGYSAAINGYHYFRKYLPDMSNPGYVISPMGLMNYLNFFPRDAHMVNIADHPYQMYTACLKMFDTGFSQQLIIPREDPVPAPSPNAPYTAYIVMLSTHADADKRIREKFPEAKPHEIFNPYRPGEGPTHRVYWVDSQGNPLAEDPVLAARARAEKRR
jgi:hypothetical protein